VMMATVSNTEKATSWCIGRHHPTRPPPAEIDPLTAVRCTCIIETCLQIKGSCDAYIYNDGGNTGHLAIAK
jgi:hypothetical protein